MRYSVVGENEVLVTEGETKIGIIRLSKNLMNWEYGTFNGAEEYPVHWVILMPSVNMGPNYRLGVTGINKAIAEVKKLLG